ncbi:hypothetical protein SH501x_002258 [Pirellulaceae bacterium SH501]
MTDSREVLKNQWLVLLLVGSLFLTVVYLLYPCVPFPGEQGESVSLSRLEHALVIFAHPEWIWEQWTMGASRLQLADRLPSLFWALICIAIYTVAGWAIGRLCNLRTHFESPLTQSWLLSFLIGYCWCGTWISLMNWGGPGRSLVTSSLGMAISLLIPWIYQRMNQSTSHSEALSPTGFRWDDVSWKRRLTGLFFLGSGILFLLQSVGSLVPSMDEEIRRVRWSSKLEYPSMLHDSDRKNIETRFHWAPLEDIRSTGWHSKSSDDGLLSLEEKVQQIVLKRYELLIAGKWIASIAWIASLILLTLRLNALHGCLVASLTTFFFAAFPSWMELIRLGRPEVVSGAAVLGILCVWLDPSGAKSVHDSRKRWIATLLLMGPIAIGLAASIQFPSSGDYRWMDAIGRAAGFSSLYSLPWVSTCLLGCIVAGSSRDSFRRWICGSAAIAIFAFVFLGGVLALPDRVWIPFSSLLVLSFAFGTERILTLRGGWGWLAFWVFAGSVSLLNVVAQPSWDNRIFADLKGSVFERPVVDAAAITANASQHRFAAEIQRKTIEGELPLDGRILLLGHWDRFDIPQRTFIQKVSKEHLAILTCEEIRQRGFTHIAIIDSAEQGFDGWDDTLEHDYRIHFSNLEKKGCLTQLSVSDRSRDLTLFQVNP